MSHCIRFTTRIVTALLAALLGLSALLALPRPVLAQEPLFSVGGYHSCAIDNGVAKCWAS